MSKRPLLLKDKLAYYLLKSVNKAIRDYEMIVNGDRIAVAVSGGKDSLTLLHLLHFRQRSALEKYELVAVHVRMCKCNGTPCLEMDWYNALKAVGLCPDPLEVVDVTAQPDDCFRCSYLRRKAIFETAQRLRCNKIALGHHADDAAQTTLLNLVFHGKIETLSPTRQFFGGLFTLIRPMIYVPEKEIARFARACAFPLEAASCVYGWNSRRALVKEVIRMLEQEYPKVKINLLHAGLREHSAALSDDPLLENGFWI